MIRGPLLLLLGGAIGALLPTWAHLPIPIYAPVERMFRLAVIGASGPPIQMTFYGVYLAAAIGALVGGCIGAVWDRRSGATHAPLLTAWALTALAIATAYQLWSVWP